MYTQVNFIWFHFVCLIIWIANFHDGASGSLPIGPKPSFDPRPVPSDDLNDLHVPYFKPDSLPPIHAINHQALKKKLGKYYDQQYMSIERPSLPPYLANTTNLSQYVVRVTKLDEKTVLPEYKDFKLIGYDGKIYKIGRDSRKKVKRWLSSSTFCQVQYRWMDLGLAIWPRYILQGSCVNQRSCSIPPGMKCRGTVYKYKRLLAYSCLIKKSLDRNGKTIVHKRCNWRKFRFPILMKCQCKC